MYFLTRWKRERSTPTFVSNLPHVLCENDNRFQKWVTYPTQCCTCFLVRNWTRVCFVIGWLKSNLFIMMRRFIPTNKSQFSGSSSKSHVRKSSSFSDDHLITKSPSHYLFLYKLKLSFLFSYLSTAVFLFE